jgi:hypothetical protein
MEANFMTEVKIPTLFATKTVDINGTEIELKGFRGNDYAILRSLQKCYNQTMGIQVKVDKIFNGRKVAELNDKEVKEIIQLRNEIEDLNKYTVPFVNRLGQRGLKRSYYPKLEGDELDKIPDIEIEDSFLKLVYKTMGEISKPNINNNGDTGKKTNSP